MKYKRIIDFLLKYKWSILFALLLLLFFTISLRNHINIFFAILNIVFVFFFVLLIGKIKNKLLQNVLVLLISFILAFSIAFSVNYSLSLELGNIASIFETNISEIASFDWTIFIFGLLCLLCATFLCRKVISELDTVFSMQVVVFVIVVVVVFANIVAVAIPVYRNSTFIEGYKKDLREQPMQTIYAFSSLRLPLLYGDIFALFVYLHEKLDFQRFKNIEKVMPEGIAFNNYKNSIPKIYLIIGESAYRGRMSLYGYDQRTTPFLDSIAKVDSSSIDFYNGIAVANMTRDAIRFSLSFASPKEKNAFWEKKNIVEMANNAGYYTTWLSNQGQAGLYDNYPSYIARSANQFYFENKIVKDDLYLLQVLEDYDGKGEKQLIVLHLMGSHFPYNQRYDEIDNSYLDSLDSIFADSNSIYDYDKSIHHTDRFIKKLYDYTINNDQSSIIVYYSDHGASPQRGIHGLQGASVTEYEIPMVILKNNVSINVDSIVSNYIDSQTRLINNLNLSYVLAELMAYSVDSETQQKAIETGRSIMLVDGSVIPFVSY